MQICLMEGPMSLYIKLPYSSYGTHYQQDDTLYYEKHLKKDWDVLKKHALLCMCSLVMHEFLFIIDIDLTNKAPEFRWQTEHIQTKMKD